MGPQESEHRPNLQDILPDPPGRHARARDAGVRRGRHLGLRGSRHEAGDGLLAQLLQAAARLHPGRHATPTEGGAHRQAALPLQHDLDHLQAPGPREAQGPGECAVILG